MDSILNKSDHPPIITADEMHMLHQAKETNLSLLDEMLGAVDEIAKGVENVSVFSHSASEASKLYGLSKAENSLRMNNNNDDYNFNNCESPVHHPSNVSPKQNGLRENDVDERMQQQAMLNHIGESNHAHIGSDNSSNQPSPSHRISAMSDPLPEGCHVSPRISAVSDPLSEGGGTSECSETGYAESIRSSDGAVVANRRWRSTAVSTSVLDDSNSGITPEQESLEQQLTMLKLRLDEATKTIQAERELVFL